MMENKDNIVEKVAGMIAAFFIVGVISLAFLFSPGDIRPMLEQGFNVAVLAGGFTLWGAFVSFVTGLIAYFFFFTVLPAVKHFGDALFANRQKRKNDDIYS